MSCNYQFSTPPAATIPPSWTGNETALIESLLQTGNPAIVESAAQAFQPDLKQEIKRIERILQNPNLGISKIAAKKELIRLQEKLQSLSSIAPQNLGLFQQINRPLTASDFVNLLGYQVNELKLRDGDEAPLWWYLSFITPTPPFTFNLQKASLVSLYAPQDLSFLQASVNQNLFIKNEKKERQFDIARLAVLASIFREGDFNSNLLIYSNLVNSYGELSKNPITVEEAMLIINYIYKKNLLTGDPLNKLLNNLFLERLTKANLPEQIQLLTELKKGFININPLLKNLIQKKGIQWQEEHIQALVITILAIQSHQLWQPGHKKIPFFFAMTPYLNNFAPVRLLLEQTNQADLLTTRDGYQNTFYHVAGQNFGQNFSWDTFFAWQSYQNSFGLTPLHMGLYPRLREDHIFAEQANLNSLPATFYSKTTKLLDYQGATPFHEMAASSLCSAAELTERGYYLNPENYGIQGLITPQVLTKYRPEEIAQRDHWRLNFIRYIASLSCLDRKGETPLFTFLRQYQKSFGLSRGTLDYLNLLSLLENKLEKNKKENGQTARQFLIELAE